MKIFSVTYFILFISLFTFQTSSSQDIALKKGAVVDSLPVSEDLTESFAMFLPRNYSEDKKWPIIFVFDPEGRGINSARLFSQAAGDQGFLIVASNSISSKDSLVINLERASRLLEKVILSFPVEMNRVYTAGLGHGALVASSLPAIYPKIRGILAVEELWMNKKFINQNDYNPSIVGFAAYKSDAVNKLNEYKHILNSKDYNYLIYKYEDDNNWPSANLIAHGLGAFTLQAMQDNSVDLDIVDRLFKAEMETAESWKRQLNYFKAFELLELMEDKYKGFDKKGEIRDLQKEIRRESVFKKQRSQFNSAKIKERELRYEYRLLIEEDLTAKSFENVGWWVQQMENIEKLQNSSEVAEVEMGYRMKDNLQTYAKERFKDLKNSGAGIDRLILLSILQTVFDKKNPEGYFQIISLSAQDGDYYTALLYLEDLLKTGYDNLEQLYEIPGTLDLKLSPEFNELVKKYLDESKYYNIPMED